jgi:predicted helicase
VLYPLNTQLKAGGDVNNRESWGVMKMKWRSKTDHTAIVHNSTIAVAGMPADPNATYSILLRCRPGSSTATGSKPIRRKASSTPQEDDDPTYSVELIKKVTAFSVKTMKIVDQLAAAPAPGKAS